MGRLENIERLVEEIEKNFKDGIEEATLRNSYKEFIETYPSLFKMIISGGDYKEIFKRMISAAKSVENGETTMETMDKKVGEELAKKYIYPNIDMSKENI